VRANRGDLRGPGSVPQRNRVEDRKAICSGKPQGIDAEVLAHFAEVMRPEPRPGPVFWNRMFLRSDWGRSSPREVMSTHMKSVLAAPSERSPPLRVLF
jgi:hypothetical protein